MAQEDLPLPILNAGQRCGAQVPWCEPDERSELLNEGPLHRLTKEAWIAIQIGLHASLAREDRRRFQRRHPLHQFLGDWLEQFCIIHLRVYHPMKCIKHLFIRNHFSLQSDCASLNGLPGE